MEIDRPDLQWSMGIYELESSVAHEQAPELAQGLLDRWYDRAIVRRLVHCPPADSLANRQIWLPAPNLSLQIP